MDSPLFQFCSFVFNLQCISTMFFYSIMEVTLLVLLLFYIALFYTKLSIHSSNVPGPTSNARFKPIKKYLCDSVPMELFYIS